MYDKCDLEIMTGQNKIMSHQKDEAFVHWHNNKSAERSRFLAMSSMVFPILGWCGFKVL